ncbi:hypothetical protein Tco_0778684 [Tanacetum coccineum]
MTNVLTRLFFQSLRSYELAITILGFLVENMVEAFKDVGPSIHRDLSRVTKVLDGGSDVLKGAIMVVEVVVKWNGGGI